MSLYELMYLTSELEQIIAERFSIFIALSSAAVVGAYVAGKHLNNVLTAGIVSLYIVTAVGFMLGRYGLGVQVNRMHLDIAEATERTNTQLHMLQGLQDTGAGNFWLPLIIYLLISVGVIFFVFYAKARMQD